ncbi:MAG: hypothetical protein PHZ14_03200 [Sulfuricella sp.]|jgi:hypothetical protein|nr:hypothetical protein [Sulfuricella sp.]
MREETHNRIESFMIASTQSLPLLHQTNVIFIPEPLRVCGNCHFWLGPRARNGRFGYAVLNGVAGRCCNKARQQEMPEALLNNATPLSHRDCPIWSCGY